METIIDSLSKFRSYRTEKVNQFIQDFGKLGGVPLMWIIPSGVFLIIIFLLWGLFATSADSNNSNLNVFITRILNCNDCLAFNFVPLIIFAVVTLVLIPVIVYAVIKYVRLQKVKKIVYMCLESLYDFEQKISSEILKDDLKYRKEYNKKQQIKSRWRIYNLEQAVGNPGKNKYCVETQRIRRGSLQYVTNQDYNVVHKTIATYQVDSEEMLECFQEINRCWMEFDLLERDNKYIDDKLKESDNYAKISEDCYKKLKYIINQNIKHSPRLELLDLFHELLLTASKVKFN